MATPTRPVYNDLWAQNGVKVAIPDETRKEGWKIEKPPYEYFNYWWNQQETFNMFVSRFGLLPYDVNVTYNLFGIAMEESEGLVYQSQQANNKGKPLSDTNYWKLLQLGASGQKVTFEIQQANHGFVDQQVLRYNGITWLLAKADIVENADALVIVESVIDSNTFMGAFSGLIKFAQTNLIPGADYWLSPTVNGSMITPAPLWEDQQVVLYLGTAISQSELLLNMSQGSVWNEGKEIYVTYEQGIGFWNEYTEYNQYARCIGTDGVQYTSQLLVDNKNLDPTDPKNVGPDKAWELSVNVQKLVPGTNVSITPTPNVPQSLTISVDIPTAATIEAGSGIQITHPTGKIMVSASGIATNAAAITVNSNGIAANLNSIGTNTTNITKNTGNITKNANDITANTSSIGTNTGNITKNTSDIADNTSFRTASFQFKNN